MSEYKNHTAIIFGYSGHAFVIIDALINNLINIDGYFEHKEQPYNPYNLHYLGQENEINMQQIPSDIIVFPGIGSNKIRKKIVAEFENNKLRQIVLRHPKSIISNTALIDKSTFISAGAIVHPLVKIGKGCIINTSAVIEHECNIGNFSHIGPGAVLAGNVTIGSESFIGANAVVKQGLRIGENVIVGAGAVVLKDIPDNEVWAGNPAKRIKQR